MVERGLTEADELDRDREEMEPEEGVFGREAAGGVVAWLYGDVTFAKASGEKTGVGMSEDVE